MQYSQQALRTKTTTQRSALKQSLASENFLSRITSNETSRKSTLLPPNQQFNSWNFLQARKESQLNTLFNIRKHKLDEITKANYVIYEKINLQDTHYRRNGREGNCKGAYSKFYTIQESRAENIHTRKVLGPICNFKPLKTPFTQSKTLQHTSTTLAQTKSNTKLNPKRPKNPKKEDESLPILFQFY